MRIKKKDSIAYHSGGRPGKIQVLATKPCSTQRGDDVEEIVSMVAVCAVDAQEDGC